jgi:hypothetical protein
LFYHQIGEEVGQTVRDVGQQVDTHYGLQETATDTQTADGLYVQGLKDWEVAKAQGKTADEFMQEYAPKTQDIGKDNQTETGQHNAVALQDRLLTTLTTKVYADQVQADHDKVANSIEQGTTQDGNMALSNPALTKQLAGNRHYSVGLVAKAGQLTNEQAAALQFSSVQHIADAGLSGWEQQAASGKMTPDQITQKITEIQGDQFYQKYASNEATKSFVEKMTTIGNSAGAVAGYQAKLQFDDGLKQLRENGGIDTGSRVGSLISQMRGDTAADTAKAQIKAKQDYESAVVYGQTTKGVMTAPSTELQPAVDSVQTAIGKETDPERLRALEAQQSALHDAVDRRKKEYAADPAAYAAKYSPVVGSAEQAFAINPNSDTFRAYADAQTAEQRRLEPYQTPSILPKTEVDRLGSVMAGARTDANGVAIATGAIQQEAQLTGRYWPQVAQELFHKHVLDQNQFIAASLVGQPGAAGVSQELMQVSMMKPEELETGNKLSLAKANKAAAAAIQPLRQSLHNSAGGDELADAYQNAISNLLMSRSKVAGADQSSQAAGLANQIIMGQYTFSGSLRIPNNAGDAGLIESGTQQVSADLKNHNLVVPPSYSGMRPGPQHDDYVLSLQTSGQWVTNGDETGATLLDANGNQVTEIKNGKRVPLELKWDALSKAASPAAQTWYKAKHVGDIPLGDMHLNAPGLPNFEPAQP